MKKYFEGIKNLEELKKAYKKLAIKLHPDMNRDRDTTKEFQEMQNEYEKLFEEVKNIRTAADGKTYTKETKETPEEYKEIIDKIIFYEKVDIEIIGSWIWLSGNTYPYKEEIKKLNFNYSKNKKAWYKSEPKDEETENKYYRGRFTMDQLREKFETTLIKSQGTKQLSC
jgi:curved DNA-binding protein CbpA